jgi:hypothetical protein
MKGTSDSKQKRTRWPLRRKPKILANLKGPAIQDLVGESERGCVIVVAALLEELLLQLHEAHIATSTYPSKARVFEDLCSVNGPLSTFAGVTQLAYAYGLIAEEDCKDLEMIRDLRNVAAHYYFALQDSGVRAHVMRLTAGRRMKEASLESARTVEGWESALGATGELHEVKRGLILNALALRWTLQGRVMDGLECLIARREGKPSGGWSPRVL